MWIKTIVLRIRIRVKGDFIFAKFIVSDIIPTYVYPEGQKGPRKRAESPEV